VPYLYSAARPFLVLRTTSRNFQDPVQAKFQEHLFHEVRECRPAPVQRYMGHRGLIDVIPERGKPALLWATKRWVVERTNSWHNAQKKLL
jgi:hypothetical protein